MDHTYYLPIESVNVAHYFSTGIIAPSKYYTNRNQDIQNKFNNYILLSKNIYTRGTDCSLKIVYNDKENSALRKISDIFFMCNKPIPISRVKRIIFENEEKCKNVLFNVNSGDAFIPETLVKIINPEKNTIPVPEKIDLPSQEINFTEKLDKFNRIMGGFALMRLGGEEYMNYSANYFKLLSYINKSIEESLNKTQLEFNDKYFKILAEDKTIVYQDITIDTVRLQAEKDNIVLNRKMGRIQIDNIKNDSQTYLLAILASYGEKASKTLDDFIDNLSTNKFNTKKEGIVLNFGINKGYAAFRNFYSIGDKKIIVKFKLDSKLDYYTIESIYQFVFNDKKENYNFPYLDQWIPTYQDTNNYGKFETYKILDKTIIYKKKHPVGSTEYLQELFQNYTPKDIYYKITQLIISWFPPLFKKLLPIEDATAEFGQYFNKELESNLKQFTNKIVTKVKADLDNDFDIERKELKDKINDFKNELSKNKDEFSNLEKNYDELVIQHDYLIKESLENEKEISNKTKLDVNPSTETKTVTNKTEPNKSPEPNKKDTSDKTETDSMLDEQSQDDKQHDLSKKTPDNISKSGKENDKEKVTQPEIPFDDDKTENQQSLKQNDNNDTAFRSQATKKPKSLQETIKKRKEELSEEGITKLKTIAKNHGVKSTNRFKNNEKDKESIINLILDKEYQR